MRRWIKHKFLRKLSFPEKIVTSWVLVQAEKCVMKLDNV